MFNNAVITRVAARFCERLWHNLSPADMSTIISGNDGEDDPRVCHSHDVCDPNLYMAEAIEDEGLMVYDGRGRMPTSIVILWNAAWGLAKAQKFRTRYPSVI
jgi:hypothetical protein